MELVLPTPLTLSTLVDQRWLLIAVGLVGQLPHVLLYFPVTVGQHLLILPIGLKRLTQGKYMLGAVMADQRFDHRFLVGMNASIGKASQPNRIPLAVENGI